MERRESTIFYSDDEGDEAEGEKKAQANKTASESDLERYTSVAVRAKISVEVEQRKRLGAWGKRVLVLDGATLYAYKTKGDGGSVGGWAIGGADVHVRRGSDSNRDDGRHILVIARPPVYKLVFAFSSVYEQARMIQALSSSGATVTGLDAIMLLKNLRQQQEQEQKEQEEREREQNPQTLLLENEEVGVDVTSTEEGQDALANNDKAQGTTENRKLVEVEKIDESIYDQGTGTVANPLYSSTGDLSREKHEDKIDGVEYSTSYGSISTSRASETAASNFQAVSANHDSEDKVNPLPKPPRASVSEGSPTNNSSISDEDSEGKNVNKTGEASGRQSVLNSGNVQEDLSRDAILSRQGQSGSASDCENSDQFGEEVELGNKDTLSEATNRLHTASDEDTEEGEGNYEFNNDPLHEGQYPESALSDKDTEGDSDRDEGNFENNYVELVSKMKLERGLSIESQTGGPMILDAGSPEVVRKILGDSPLSDVSIKTLSPINETESDKGYSVGKSDWKKGLESQNSAVSDDVLSDNDEKFEQLYRELSSNGITTAVDHFEKKDTSKTIVSNNNDNQDQSKAEDNLKVTKNDNELPNGIAKETETVNDDDRGNEKYISEDEQSPQGTPLKRVSSIIKKTGSPSSTGKPKRVQFNLDTTTIDSGSSPRPLLSPKAEQDELAGIDHENTKDTALSRTLSLKKSKKEPMSSPTGSPTKKKPEGSASPAPTPSPTKKKGIFSIIFTSSSSKKSYDVAPPKEDTASKKDLTPTKVDTYKKDTPPTKVDTIKKDIPPTKVDTIKKDTPPTKVDTIKKDIPPTKVDTIKKGIPPTKVDTIKKDIPPTKVDTSLKKAPVASQATLRRQPTVDITAPLIIGGSVEMGGSISGKVSARRIEVRDGHVLAYMPKATSPMSRLSLVGLSVSPMIGGVHSNSLSLTRASRCMMVIKLTSREEMMRWINVLSDEVIKLTPENQRSGLVLYPSLKKEEPEKKAEEEDYEKSVPKKSQEIEKETKKKSVLTNGKTAEQGNMSSAKKKTEVGKSPHSLHNEEVVVNGNKEEVADAEDTNDGWLRKKKQPIMEEFEMDELQKSLEKSSDNKRPTTIKSNNAKSPTNRQSDGLKVVEEHFNEDKESIKTERKINKLNIEERWKEHRNTKNIPQKGNSPVQRRSLDSRQHQPLRRLSAQDNAISRPKSEGQDTAGNLLFVNNPPKHDYHANCHPPLERLSNRSRMLSASESNLRRAGDQKPASNIHHLHRFGSELTLLEKPKKEFNNNMISGTKDTSNVLVSSRIIRNQANVSKIVGHQGKMNGASPTSSPSHNRNKRSHSFEPRQVEIVESKRSSSQELHKIGIDESPEEESQWYDEDESIENNSDPSNDNLTGITWSVAATREKFELLCSFSGENKGGKLTTKTPISRKKSVRNSIKKRRSLEGGAGKRPNSRRNVRRSILANNSNSVSSPSQPGATDTAAIPEQIIDNYRAPTPQKLHELDASPKPDQTTFKLQPVRDRRKNFERDITDSLNSLVNKSSSVDSLSDIVPMNHNDDRVPATNEQTSTQKSPLRRTQNILHDTTSPCSSPEPSFISSKLINGRPKGNIPDHEKGIVSRSLATENQMDAEKDSEVVICWRGPYIAQEAEQAVLSNISNAFLAKRRLLAREVAVARIQDKLSALEETIWDIQASMAEIDKTPSSANAKATNNWKVLERSLRTAEDEMTYWTSRLSQTQKEADEAREKLATALVTGLAQYNAGGEKVHQKQRQQILKRSTKRDLGEEDEEEDEEADFEHEEVDSFA